MRLILIALEPSLRHGGCWPRCVRGRKNARVVLFMNEYIFIPHSISAQAKNRNQLANSPFESRYEPGSFSYQMANPLAE